MLCVLYCLSTDTLNAGFPKVGGGHGGAPHPMIFFFEPLPPLPFMKADAPLHGVPPLPLKNEAPH